MAGDLQNQGQGGLPTLGDWLANWLGFQLPSIPMPQTAKNLDKAVGKILLAAGENVEARIKANTGKQEAKGEIEIEGMYRTEEDRRKIENRAATVKVAVDELNANPNQKADAAQEIDDDWLNLYAKLAEDKSSEELRSLFGKILAGEIRKPGSFSLRTMQFVSALSRDEAHKISEFFAFVLSDELVPTPRDLNNEKLPGFRPRKLMEELGIASTSNPIGGLEINPQVLPHNTLCFIASGYAILIRNNSDETLKFSFSLPNFNVAWPRIVLHSESTENTN
ncbi:DUF2806 domain-containing protein [Bradyrhizobium sp. cir1]|uniref:DUF2806 domain-containing protein n=1 Tax=Bradyrhizobium sp. cir1 TaxID=1445730 RepID=UPI001AEDF83B|nr:DUF2806 domain-containing protein [Bradyrhizobium sp. cir1]